MKKSIRILALALIGVMFLSSFATIAYAKDLQECYHCNTTGEFHCKECNNAGEVTCGVCGGEGKSKCTGESGKGCDDGYYTCPNCNGDGKNRSGDGKIIEGVCGNCGGAGKLRCVVCHTVPGWNICNGCDGKGKQECQSSNCKDSKAVGWKCHYCMGAGYLLTNFWPGENDGIQNVPVNGDLIWLDDGKSHVYSNGSVSLEPASNHNVSFGTGSWKIGDVTVTADKTGTQKISTIEIITLTNFDPDTMEVRVVDENGDGLILKVTNGKTSISANDHDGGIPYDLTFMVCEKEAVSGGNEGDDENNNNGDNPNQAGKYIVWFGEGSWKIGDVTVTADKTDIQYLNENDIITLKNFDADTMEVRLEAEDGFRTTLLVNNGKTSLSANTNNGPIAIDIAFFVVAKEANPSGEEDNDNDDDKNHGNSENPEGKYIVWFGEGSWKIGDVTVTADKTNVQYLTETDIITLTNFDPDTMEVRVEAEDGFRTTLLVNNGKTSISANTNNGPVATDIVFSVVAKVGDTVIIPSDRNQDFEISSTESSNSKQSASARVEVGKMTEKEQANYAGVTDEELNKKLVNVKDILNSVRLGEFADNTEEIVNEIAKLNGIDNLEDGKIFPLSFTGHENLGFPIAVTVRLEKGMLESDTDLFIYHILEDETIESLGKAEYTRYDDGSVENITFYTTGFSTFFTSTTELSISDSITATEGSEQELDKDNYLWIWGVLTVVVVGAAIICVGLMKKKNNKL